MLISTDYKAQNEQLHQSRPDYGTSGQRWASMVVDLCAAHNTRDVLDYGCGKGTLQGNLDFMIKQYDPCIAGRDTPPHPADIVVCTDVMEHIEPACLDAVLDDLKRCTRRLILLTIATGPAKKCLPDGRNAHICLLPAKEWLARIQERLSLKYFKDMDNEHLIIAAPL